MKKTLATKNAELTRDVVKLQCDNARLAQDKKHS